MHTLSIKIDTTLEKTLATLAKREKVSRSEVVRRALQAYATRQSGIANPTTPSALDLAGDLVGCFFGAPADLSSNPGHIAHLGRA